ncbi:unnamed protein product [Echinostoma caproni]|uniref:Uncharacterized protein n=1 Tax=Echinostoma caproni TaxID=27848 RepID=A0A183B2A3_9TREM|nr:unnamed protein product [Echinostoma caproni]
MYSHIFISLSTDILEQVFQFIILMPKNHSPAQLKEALFNGTAVLHKHRLDELFGDLKIDDRTPFHSHAAASWYQNSRRRNSPPSLVEAPSSTHP